MTDAPDAVTATFFDQPSLWSVSGFATLCDGYRLENVGSMAQLTRFIETASRRHAGHRLLVTLDDFDQACYKAFRGEELQKLSALPDPSTPDAPLDDSNPQASDLGYFTVKAAFPQRLRNLRARADDCTFDDLENRLIDTDYFEAFDDAAEVYYPVDQHTGTDYSTPIDHHPEPPDVDGADFFYLNANPDRVLDQSMFALIAPVARACDALAAFAPCYFADSLRPTELYRFAERLETAHGYEIFGVGAATAAFRRTRPLDAEAAAACARDLLRVRGRADDRALLARVASVLQASPLLLYHHHTP